MRTFLSSPEEIIEEARNGKMFILVDDEDRENEGDLVIPAQMATPTAINFMAKHGRGLICLALTRTRVDQLGLPLMVAHNGSRHETAFTVSIEAKEHVTTGISAADRARTIAVAINGTTAPSDIVTPGHVFPLAARDGGVLVRAGHTEAAVDVSRLAGLNPSGVICEIMAADGTMARLDALVEFARTHRMKIGTIRDLIAYRLQHDHLVRSISERRLNSRFGGEWNVKTYLNTADNKEHMVLQKGVIDPAVPTLVRMHAVSLFADMLGEDSSRTGLLQLAMDMISQAGSGVIVLLRDTRVSALAQAMNPIEPDGEFLRNYGVGAQILTDLGVHEMRLLTNSPHKTLVALQGYGLRIVEELRLSAR
ncbi:MAG TPA: 3,4-dihydroxy-2-butanone-4-phosphate synthase [Sphingobium sp.]|uniref:3,4-dihydroxy-2-butanone-4-phosphate synthase n=1 Tax=Sphingobium sp. TaxID=1912891 RepID=UPI002ED3ECC0